MTNLAFNLEDKVFTIAAGSKSKGRHLRPKTGRT